MLGMAQGLRGSHHEMQCVQARRDASWRGHRGEYYLTEQVTRVLLERAEAAVQRGAEIEILRYAA